MNKLLRDFERESGLEIYGLGAVRDKWEATMEQFAELIIEECIDYAYRNGDHISYLKEHFGVES